MLTACYADYLIPTVHEVPADVRVGHIETPSPFTEYGIRAAVKAGVWARLRLYVRPSRMHCVHSA